MHWKMSVLISLIYTVSTFLYSEEQILIISAMRNKNQVFPVCLWFVLFSLGLNNKDDFTYYYHVEWNDTMNVIPSNIFWEQEGSKAE